MDSFNDVMDAVKAYCKGRVSDASYRVFIQDLNLLNFEGTNIIILEVPNDVVMRFAAARYADLLKEAFASILGFEVELKFVLAAPAPDGGISRAKVTKILESYNKAAVITPDPGAAFGAFAAEFALIEAAGGVVVNDCGQWLMFIYGPSGLGKTHLLNAIKIEIQKNHPDFNIVYVDCEKFTNETITAIKTATMEQFRQRYRKADVLLIDDIQFLAGKESTQEEFFHTFNTLHNDGRQIVIASDRPAKEIKSLEERLRTRFEWGLTADIQPPDFETRVAIVKRKAELLNLDLPNDVAEYIANHLKQNIRQLEGAVKKLNAYYLLEGIEPCIGVTTTAIKDTLNDSQPIPVTIEKILNEVARTYNVMPSDIRGKKRNANVSAARQMTMYIIREVTGMSMEAIGQEFQRDHSTVVYSIKTMEENIKRDQHLKEMCSDIMKNVRT